MSEGKPVGTNPAPSKEVQFPIRSSSTPPAPRGDHPLWQAGAVVGLIAIVAAFGALEFRDRWQSQIAVPDLPLSRNGTGTLSVTADDGVQVFVNDQLRGIGPFVSPITLMAGTYLLKYLLNGQEIGSENVVVAAGNITRTKASATNSLTVKRLSVKPVATPVPPADTSVAPGRLAISALIPAEIYKDDQHLGTTPVTLELPAGTHTLEFRYGNLKKTGTYVVRSNEATTAAVDFDIVVQINARPWAQVFVDGIQQRPLGPTPMSDVRVSVGNVLVFRHPSFPEKKVRVTGGQPSILVAFP